MKKLILIIVIGAIGAYLYFEDRELTISNLETNAVSAVDQILENSAGSMLAESMGMDVAKCSRVTIVEKVGNNTYTGVAVLDNENIFNVKIQDLGESLTVEIIE